MDYLYLLLSILVLSFIWNNFNGSDTIGGEKGYEYEPKIENPTNIGFVKPEQKLLRIFSNFSNGTKIKLSGKCRQFIYIKNTIPTELNEKILVLIEGMLSTINNISANNYFIKTIDNVYCSIDRKNNQRYVIDFFIYDTKNYYSVRLITDIVIIDDVIYLNYLHIQSGSNPTLTNKYDIKFNSIGILFDSNMFHEDLLKIFDNYYANSFKVIGVSDTNLEYTNEDLTEVPTLHTIANSYIPMSVSKKSYNVLENKGLHNHLDMYLPGNQNMIKSKVSCEKYKTQWDKYGIAIENEIEENCILHNNSTISELNHPYISPGVITQRVDDNDYQWLSNPATKNIIPGQGY